MKSRESSFNEYVGGTISHTSKLENLSPIRLKSNPYSLLDLTENKIIEVGQTSEETRNFDQIYTWKKSSFKYK